MTTNTKSVTVFTLAIGTAILTVALGATAGLRGETNGSAFQGVWQVVEVVTTGPGAAVIKPSAAEPNLIIFSGRHYSRTEVHSAQPRPIVTDWKNATADQLRAAWGPFVAEAGTFEATGDAITVRPQIAKNPGTAMPGAFTVLSYRLEDNLLMMTLARDQRGVIANPPTITLSRVE